MSKARFFISHDARFNEWQLRFISLNEDGSRMAAQPISVRHFPKDEPIDSEPMLTLRESADLGKEVFQSLMDELWNVGIRPTDIGTAGHLASTQHHLNDMRKLVEKFADVKLNDEVAKTEVRG